MSPDPSNNLVFLEVKIFGRYGIPRALNLNFPTQLFLVRKIILLISQTYPDWRFKGKAPDGPFMCYAVPKWFKSVSPYSWIRLQD